MYIVNACIYMYIFIYARERTYFTALFNIPASQSTVLMPDSGSMILAP